MVTKSLFTIVLLILVTLLNGCAPSNSNDVSTFNNSLNQFNRSLNQYNQQQYQRNMQTQQFIQTMPKLY